MEAWLDRFGWICMLIFFSHKAEQLNASSNGITTRERKTIPICIHSHLFTSLTCLKRKKSNRWIRAGKIQQQQQQSGLKSHEKLIFLFRRKKNTSIQFLYVFNSKLWKSQKKKKRSKSSPVRRPRGQTLLLTNMLRNQILNSKKSDSLYQ